MVHSVWNNSWWQKCLDSHNDTRLLDVDWTDGTIYHIYTDASDFGYGPAAARSGLDFRTYGGKGLRVWSESIQYFDERV